MRTQKNVSGMRVQNESWKALDTQLPCSSCVAGKMRKYNAAKASNYCDLKTLTTHIIASQNPARHYGFAVSRTPATTAQSNERNKLISVDWAIIHKENLPDEFNVFALFHDAKIGLVHVEFQPTRGQAGEALEGYIQRWGIPDTIHHDNAPEFLHGKFASVCREYKIHQTQSVPYPRIKTRPRDTWKSSSAGLDHSSSRPAFPSPSFGLTLSLTGHIYKTS